MTILFVETSALLRAVLREAGGDELQTRLRGARRILASRLIRVEAERALLRLAVDRPSSATWIADVEHDLRAFWPHVHFFEMTAEICELAGRIAPASRLRTLDAIHLATFASVRRFEPAVEMLSCDDRILREL